MSKCPYIPPHPKPLTKDDKQSKWNLIKRVRKSWIHTAYEGTFKNELTKVKLPRFQLFVAKAPKDIRKIMVEEYKKFPKNNFLDSGLAPLLGNSILTTNGEVWERQRRMMTPSFANAGIKKVFPIMIEAIRACDKRLQKYSEEQGELQVDVEMTTVTADIIMRTILSSPLDAEEAESLYRDFEEFQERVTKMSMLHSFRIPKILFIKDYIQWKRKGKAIRERIGRIIRSRLEDKSGENEYGDILEALMRAEDPETNTKFDETELIDQVVVLFFAGHETSASVLGWSLYILANQPEHFQALREEADSLYEDLESLNFSMVNKLKKARNVFKETMRLYPPVSYLPRVAEGENELNGCPVAHGSSVMLSPYITQRHREIWEEPNAFNPERFENGESKANKDAYFPFGMGPRTCIGAAFAQQEALIILSYIAKKYDLAPIDEHVPDPVARLTLRSDNGIRVKLSMRKS